MSALKKFIITTPDFPKKGVEFKDFFPLLKDHLPQTLQELSKLTSWENIDYIAGIESRGFILAAALATKLEKGFLPIRKKGKLPPPLVSESYSLEYGQDTLEMQISEEKKNIVIVDDVLATGGTFKASLNLSEKAGYKVRDKIALIDLTFLNNLRNTHEVKSLIQY